jgi:hypothetical protein
MQDIVDPLLSLVPSRLQQINKERQSAWPGPAAMAPSLPPGNLHSTSPLHKGARRQICYNTYCSIVSDHAVHLLVPIECLQDADASPSTFSASS